MPTKKSFHIVAIGASAGGLEPLIALLKIFPKKVNLALVVIQHLEPKHKSFLSEILSRETSLKVYEARNNQSVEPSKVYVMPPNSIMAISGKRLKVSARSDYEGQKFLPVDFFMTALAKDQNKDAIGVVLSGTGSDGTRGARAIRDQGGLVFVQDAKTAKYYGMPDSIIKNGSVDCILEPGGIAKKLMEIASGSFSRRKLPKTALNEEEALNQILIIIRNVQGADFTHYKRATVCRRISRRMAYHGLKTYSEYYLYLKNNPSESGALVKDILIPVTSFFRDEATFNALKKKVFPVLVTKRSAKDPVRVWIPACSTGEEVYSVAMALYEFMDERKIRVPVQIFGTDINETLVTSSRSGFYREDISSSVSAERLRRFFVKMEKGYKIAKFIRELCVFAKQDITADPPLSNMDLISCRNVLIYMDTSLQGKVLYMFNYALKPNGFLVLGTSESVTSAHGAFKAFDGKHKVFTKNVLGRTAMPGKMTFAAPSNRHAKEQPQNQRLTDKAPLVKTLQKRKKNKSTGDIIKEKEALNEELRAANEEIQSSNEELQSMNEELETSKEELQSTNEELLTLNDELQNRNSELLTLNSDLNNFFASASIPIIIVGHDLHIKRFTPMARKVMNLIPSDMDRPIGDMKLNIDLPNLESLILDVIESMVPKEIEVIDNDKRWYMVTIRPYRTVENKIDGAVIAMFDITERKEAEKMRTYVTAIVEFSSDMIISTDTSGIITSWNKTAQKLTGYTPQEAIGRPITFCIPSEFGQGQNTVREQILEQKIIKNYDTVCLLKDGQMIPVSLTVSPIKDSKGTIMGISYILHDITERKSVEENLARNKKYIEKLVEQQGRDLANATVELEKGKRLTDIGVLAATIAHELRNPLAAISIAIENIKRKDTNARFDKYLNTVSTKIKESDRIINNLLFYSRIKPPHFERVNLYAVLKECIDILHSRSKAEVDIKENLQSIKDVFIDADPLQIKEVVDNILNNCYDAVQPINGQIAVISEAGPNTVTLKFKDNGSGIEKNILEKVFDPFFTTKATGTGLGLAVVRQIVQMHNGTISIESQLGKGAAVTLVLPRKKDGK
ncbi:MAG: chemotaxis protein CheB [Candidatus Omnitrophota bacterium]